MATLKFETVLVSEVCCNCGVQFAMPSGLKEKRLEDKKYFYCPNGHGQYYAESEADRLKRDLEKLAAERDTVQAERDRAWTSLKRSETELKKLKTRTRNGVCEACHRTFGNLQRHMQTQHPDLVKAVKAGGE